MNIVRKAVGNFALKMAGMALSLSSQDDSAWRQFFNVTSATGRAVNDDSAMRVTTAFACVRTLSETVGQVTGAVFERQKNGNAEKVDHPLADVLFGRPNLDMTSLEFREAMTTNLAGRGNAYALIDTNGSGQVSNLYPYRASKVEPKRKDSGDIVYRINDRGRWETMPADKVWHWKGFSWDGLVGLSPIACAREALGLSMAAEDYNAKLFANGLTSTALIQIPQWLTKDQRKIAEEKLASLQQGLANAGRPIMLEGGMTAKDGIFTPEDAQFLQLRQLQIPELCRIWRISPHMIASLERATNNNIEQLSQEFVTYTMLPYFRRIEERAQQLFKPGERSRFFVRFNVESLLRADSQARASLYSILLQNGVYSRNEVRALENRNRVDEEGMDDYTVQSNMALLQLLGAMNAAASQPKPAPKPEPMPDPEIEPKPPKSNGGPGQWPVTDAFVHGQPRLPQ